MTEQTYSVPSRKMKRSLVWFASGTCNAPINGSGIIKMVRYVSRSVIPACTPHARNIYDITRAPANFL